VSWQHGVGPNTNQKSDYIFRHKPEEMREETSLIFVSAFRSLSKRNRCVKAATPHHRRNDMVLFQA